MKFLLSFCLAIVLGLTLNMARASELDAQLTGTNTAGANNLGNALTNNFYSPGPLPFTESVTTFHGQPVATAGPAIATPAVWRCATAGAGLALQLRDIGLGASTPGGESFICAQAFRIAVVEGTEKLTGAAYTVAKALACGDDAIANAYESTAKQCDAPSTTDARKQRWASEARARSVLSGLPPPVLATQRPMPWQAGG